VKEIKKKVDQALEKANKAKKKTTARKAAAAPAPKEQAPEKKKLPEKYKKALKMLAAGKSQREVERELHICRKTLRKLLREQG
jgi:DNA-binding NarL/FixJ family response regulator